MLLHAIFTALSAAFRTWMATTDSGRRFKEDLRLEARQLAWEALRPELPQTAEPLHPELAPSTGTIDGNPL